MQQARLKQLGTELGRALSLQTSAYPSYLSYHNGDGHLGDKADHGLQARGRNSWCRHFEQPALF